MTKSKLPTMVMTSATMYPSISLGRAWTFTNDGGRSLTRHGLFAPSLVKMPPTSRAAEKATVPESLIPAKPKRLKGPLLSTIFVKV